MDSSQRRCGGVKNRRVWTRANAVTKWQSQTCDKQNVTYALRNTEICCVALWCSRNCHMQAAALPLGSGCDRWPAWPFSDLWLQQPRPLFSILQHWLYHSFWQNETDTGARRTPEIFTRNNEERDKDKEIKSFTSVHYLVSLSTNSLTLYAGGRVSGRVNHLA